MFALYPWISHYASSAGLKDTLQSDEFDGSKLSEIWSIEVETHHIFTCAISTARFLAQQNPSGSAYVIGDAGLLNALHINGYAINEIMKLILITWL